MTSSDNLTKKEENNDENCCPKQSAHLHLDDYHHEISIPSKEGNLNSFECGFNIESNPRKGFNTQLLQDNAQNSTEALNGKSVLVENNPRQMQEISINCSLHGTTNFGDCYGLQSTFIKSQENAILTSKQADSSISQKILPQTQSFLVSKKTKAPIGITETSQISAKEPFNIIFGQPYSELEGKSTKKNQFIPPQGYLDSSMEERRFENPKKSAFKLVPKPYKSFGVPSKQFRDWVDKKTRKIKVVAEIKKMHEQKNIKESIANQLGISLQMANYWVEKIKKIESNPP